MADHTWLVNTHHNTSKMQFDKAFFAPGKWADYCDGVCMSVSLSAHVSQNPRLNFTKFYANVTCGSGSVSFDDCVIGYLLLVFWMT